MFGWFKPCCPCDVHAKAWIEERLHWLHDEFPDNVYNGRRMILPLKQFFPDPYDESPRSVRTLFDRVCDYMEVDPHTVDMEIVDDLKENFWLSNETGDLIPQAAGTFTIEDDGIHVRIDRTGLHDPMSLVGTMAHELAHARLLGERRYLAEYYDNELLTDLTVVYLGLGIFLANSPRHYRSIDGQWPNTQAVRPEYMTPPMFGWAMAHVAWHNNEQWPAWARHLKIGPRGDLKQGLRYLWTTEDSTFKP
jgi:hypothetical protein